MKHRKTAIRLALVSLLLITALMLTACPSDTVHNLATASKDASNIVDEFQNGEIAAYQQGIVSVDDHATIQGLLVKYTKVGKSVNEGLRAAKDNAGALSVLQVAVAQVDALQQDGVLGIKNADTRAKWTLAMVGVKTTLNTLIAVLQPPKA